MTERRDELSTADLAAQQPTNTAPPDTEAADLDDRAVGVEPRGHPLEQDPRRSTDAGVAQAPEPMPADASATRSAPDSATPDTRFTAGPLLASEDAEGFRARWTDVQTAFVDAPRQSVQQADALVADLMQRLAKSFADERGQLERQWDRGDDVPTDDLRTAFQRYRSFFERLLAT